jgi:ASC-1-like (ASCH) protein
MKLPKKYLTQNPKVMKREIMKHKDKEDSDSSAYGPWDADYKSRKAGKGKKVETKPSKYTKKFKEMYEEDVQVNNKIISFDEYKIPEDIFEEIVIEEGLTEEDLIEEGMSKTSPVYKALKKKSDKTGFPLGILRQVWNRGYAAWKTGHVPGTTPQQWAMARVNSFLVGGRTTEVGDKALYKQAKANRKEKK